MNLEVLALTGMARYPENNEFYKTARSSRISNFAVKTPLGYEYTKQINIPNGTNRKIPAVINCFKYWVTNDESDYVRNGLARLDLGKLL